MIDFSLSGSPSSTNGITTTTHGTNGILRATPRWRASTGRPSAGGGNISAYSAYTGGNLGLLAPSAALNVSPTGSQTAVTAADTFNTLNLSGTVSVSMSGPGHSRCWVAAYWEIPVARSVEAHWKAVGNTALGNL